MQGGKYTDLSQFAIFSSKNKKDKSGEKNDYLWRRVIINMYVSRN